jgi:hypothetical protein
MAEQQIERVRRMCLALPRTEERLSHGEPTWFVGGKVFVMFANNHHNDGRIAVWLPAPPGSQEAIIAARPDVFFMPPYVGKRGWVGVQLERIADAELRAYVDLAWELIGRQGRRARTARRSQT